MQALFSLTLNKLIEKGRVTELLPEANDLDISVDMKAALA